MRLSTRLNGEEVQSTTVSEMIFDIPTIAPSHLLKRKMLSGGGTSLALAANDEQIMKAIMATRCRRSDKNRFIVRNSYLKTLSTMAQL